MVGGAAVTVLASDPGETDALPSLRVTPATDGKLCVTAALLTSLRPEVPESVETSLALLARNSGLAGALTGQQVTLGELAGLATFAGQAAVRSVLVEAPVVGLALVAPLPLHPGQTLALASHVVTFRCPVQVTVAGPAVLLVDGVTKEPRLQLYQMVIAGY